MKKILSLVMLFLVTFAFAQEKVSFFFDNNKFELNKTEYAKLTKWIIENQNSKILSITGSTDEVGSSGYNDTLSQNRVNFIYSHIKDKVQIRADFKTISLGEKGVNSSNKAQNRKAIIHFLQEKDLAKENEILGTTEIIEEIIEIPDSLPLVEKVKLARVGTKIVLKNINFYQNTFATVPESQPALWDLFQILVDNPALKIENTNIPAALPTIGAIINNGCINTYGK